MFFLVLCLFLDYNIKSGIPDLLLANSPVSEKLPPG